MCFCKYDVRVMDRFHRQDSGGPTANQLCQPELSGSLQRPFVMSRLEWPDSLLQPVEQCEVIGRAAHERLAEVHVRLHKPRQSDLSRRVQNRSGSFAQPRSKCPNPTSFNPQITRQDIALRVHGHEGSILNENR